ncbi:DUF551 domain-containing protein [Salmonella enterica subsp. enterica serovar Poona]
MTTFTKEQLIEMIKRNITVMDRYPDLVTAQMDLEVYKIALASLEAEPVAYIFKHPAGKLFWALTDESNKEQPDVIPVYADSPAPVVPDEIDVNDVPRAVTYFKTHRDCYADGWNACRAAMLQSGNFRENKSSSTNNFREIAETSTNYPVIPSEVLSAIQKVAKIRADFDDFDGDRRGIGDCLDEAEQELIVTINKYASQLAAEPIAPNDVREQTAIPQVPVTPDGWVMVPKRLTAENGAKGALSGEFSETTFISCLECFGDDDCDTCDGSGRIEIKVPVTWSTIKSIWDKGIEYFAAKPSQEVK